MELNGIIDSVYSPYDNEWEKGYKKCMAGVTNLEIDPSGMAFLCDNVPAERFSIFEYDFDYIWKKLYQQRKEYIERDSVCVKCQNHDKCGLCAPTILLEYGSYYSKPITECVFMERLEECLKERTKDETCR